jgi:hypothetical protein
MWLLIDDMRDSMGCDIVARNLEAGKKMLEVCDWECVCLDHDLGAGESGYDILKWAFEKGRVPSHVQLVTNNPVGRKNMANLLKDNGYNNKNGLDFFKVGVEK